MSCDDVERVKKIEFVKQHVRSYPDFPKKGILFRDIFSVFNDVEATRTLDCLIADHVKNLQKPIDAVIGLESRGFLFGPQIASILGVPFVPARKKGKLPGELIRLEYSLEYGTDVMEVQKESLAGKKSVLIVDDLLATGGTMKAAVDLATSTGANVVECFVILELADLKGRDKIPVPCHSLIVYD
ncbi:adenine phosphoribosyltransferase [Nesidiocoris tenuis]|nr:adenine phosphoribosyltransferase [Nesidiocoris tenuis]